MKLRLIFSLMIILLAAFPGLLQAQETDPAAIVIASAEAFSAWDLDAAQAFFADDAVYRLEFFDETYTGLQELREWWEFGVSDHFKIEVEVIKVDGNTVTTNTTTWYDTTRSLGIAPIEGTDVYVVENGKIKSVIWTPTEESVAKFQAALPPEEMPLTGSVAFPTYILAVVLGITAIWGGIRLAMQRHR